MNALTYKILWRVATTLVLLCVTSYLFFGRSVFYGLKNPLYEKYLVSKSERGDKRSMRKLCEYYLRTKEKHEVIKHYAEMLAESNDEYGRKLLELMQQSEISAGEIKGSDKGEYR